jgi:hypothetical protein
MGGCLTKEEEVNAHLTNLNDSRHVMMRRSSLKQEVPVPMDGTAYKPRQNNIPMNILDELAEMDLDEEEREVEAAAKALKE